MTPLHWQRPILNHSQTQYHVIRDGVGLCGKRVTTGYTLPRVLTARQIETQACKRCVAKSNEGDKRMTERNVAKVADVLRRHEPERGHREAYCSCGAPIGDWGIDWPEHIGGIVVRALGISDTERGESN